MLSLAACARFFCDRAVPYMRYRRVVKTLYGFGVRLYSVLLILFYLPTVITSNVRAIFFITYLHRN